MIIFETNTGKLYEITPTKAGENYMTCPVCSAGRKKKRDKCFCWNDEKKVGRCNHCEATFSVHSQLRQREAKAYAVPEWKNITALSDKAVHWFGGRMISQNTLLKRRIYTDQEFMPQFGKACEVICFPYFRGEKLVNIKFRGPQKSFRMVKDAELIFSNFDTIATSKELIICEGEMDELTFEECGYWNVCSVPNGAGATDLTYLDNYVDALDHIEKFYIAADFDEAGLKLRNELIRRLGVEKCRIVTYKGYKDANELFCKEFKAGIDEVLKTASEIPIEGYLNLQDQYDDIYSMFQNGLSQGDGVGMESLDEHLRWETGRLAVWTGIPSHGKSEFVDFLMVKMNLCHGWKTLYFSPENYPLKCHFSKIAEKITGCKFKQGKLSEEDFEEVFSYIEDNFFWLEPYQNATIDSILERAKLFVKRKGIKQLVIDPFNCLEQKALPGETDTKYIGRFLDELTRFAKQYDVLVHLVAHPAKMEKINGTYKAPTLYDISGSANFNNKADYGISIYRNFATGRTSLIPLKVRFKNLGSPAPEGIELQYNLENGRYEVPVGDVYLLDNSNWLHPTDASEPNLPWGNTDDGYPF
ncbi:MAG: bifunctional DNA primase/helicase [Alistipes sp.]